MGGGKSSLRILYEEYNTVIDFGIVLLLLVVLSYGLAPLIPAELYQHGLRQILSGCVASVSLFGAGLVLSHHDNMRARKLWGFVLIVWAVLATLMLLHVIGYDEARNDPDFISLRGWELVVGNVYAWLLLVYPVEVLRPGWLTVKRALLHLLPVAVVAVVDYLLPIDLRWILMLYPVVLVGFLITHIRAYRKWCEDNYSSMENIDVQWIWRYIVMYLISGATYSYMCVRFDVAHAFTQLWLLLLMLAYSTGEILFRPDPWTIVIRRSKAKKAEMAAEKDQAAEEDATDPEASNEVYRKILEEWMDGEKPYTNPEFRLLDMREVLPLNRTYLSQLINTEYGCNFYQYVTNYRIKEAKRLMQENPDMKMQDIADQCGFSSPTVFSRTFVRETGVTPREWNIKSDNS